MSLALARKYRPRTFAEVAVQSHVSNTLKGAIARGRVAHGYLLCGPRGVGKTTLARVLAMALNCEVRIAAARDFELSGAASRQEGSGPGAGADASSPQVGSRTGASSEAARAIPIDEPCGHCPSCTRIWNGSTSMDVLEIDAASNRGVDDARELRERAMYAPSGDDRWKVYIVDEAHMLTREAWNALLKILEEPPPRVVFVFATTEPHRIAQSAAPVLSRLQRFDFKRMSPADVKERLVQVFGAEGIAADPDALAMLARAADGSMRDALSLADQVLALGDERHVTGARVRDALGLVAEDEYLALLTLVAERRAGDVFGAITRLVDGGIDLGQFLTGFGDMVRAQLAVALGATPDDLSAASRTALSVGKDRFAAADLVRMLSAMAELEPKFRRSTQQQILLEMLLVRFALLDRTVEIEDMLRQLGAEGEKGGAPAGAATRGTRDAGSGTQETGIVPVGGRPGNFNADTRDPGTTAAPGTARRLLEDSGPGVARPPASAPPARRGAGGDRTGALAMVTPSGATVVAEAPVGTPLDINAIAGAWDELVDVVRRERPMLGSVMEHFLPTAVTARGVLSLQAESAQSFENLSAKLGDLTTTLRTRIPGLQSIALRPPVTAGNATPERMSHATVRSDRVTALRKRDPVLRAAIDELDLELID